MKVTAYKNEEFNVLQLSGKENALELDPLVELPRSGGFVVMNGGAKITTPSLARLSADDLEQFEARFSESAWYQSYGQGVAHSCQELFQLHGIMKIPSCFSNEMKGWTAPLPFGADFEQLLLVDDCGFTNVVKVISPSKDLLALVVMRYDVEKKNDDFEAKSTLEVFASEAFKQGYPSDVSFGNRQPDDDTKAIFDGHLSNISKLFPDGCDFLVGVDWDRLTSEKEPLKSMFPILEKFRAYSCEGIACLDARSCIESWNAVEHLQPDPRSRAITMGLYKDMFEEKEGLRGFSQFVQMIQDSQKNAWYQDEKYFKHFATLRLADSGPVTADELSAWWSLPSELRQQMSKDFKHIKNYNDFQNASAILLRQLSESVKANQGKNVAFQLTTAISKILFAYQTMNQTMLCLPSQEELEALKTMGEFIPERIRTEYNKFLAAFDAPQKDASWLKQVGAALDRLITRLFAYLVNVKVDMQRPREQALTELVKSIRRIETGDTTTRESSRRSSSDGFFSLGSTPFTNGDPAHKATSTPAKLGQNPGFAALDALSPVPIYG